MQKHQNGDTPASMGYWAGVKLKLPTGIDTTKRFYFGTTPQDTTTPTWYQINNADATISAALDSGTTDEVSFYTDIETNKKAYVVLEGADSKNYSYIFDYSGVTLKSSN